MFDNKDTANEFLKYLNSLHNSSKVTTEFEQAQEITFLDIVVNRCPNNTLSTSAYRKEDIYWILHQMAFIYTTQIQNQPYPHAKLSMLPFAPPLHCYNPLSRISKKRLLQNG